LRRPAVGTHERRNRVLPLDWQEGSDDIDRLMAMHEELRTADGGVAVTEVRELIVARR